MNMRQLMVLVKWQVGNIMIQSKFPEMLQSFISEKNVFAIVYKENNKVIGSLGLHESWANDESDYAHLKIKEIGYVLSKAYWGRD